MKFNYRNFGKGLIRPVIPVVISYKNIKIPYRVLVDSGADFSLFDVEVARLLGIPLESGEKSDAFGISGSGNTIYIHTLTLKVGNVPLKIKAGFLQNMTQVGYGIVGQVGFFDKFEVKFDYQNQEIELIEKEKKKTRSLFWSTILKEKK